MTAHQKNCLQGIIWAMIAVAVWSGSLVLLRLGVTTSLNAYDLTALRFGIAALLLLPVVLRHGLAFDRLKLSGFVLMVGGFGAPYIILISLALKTAPASAAGAINPGVMAIGSVLMGAVAFGDRIGPARLVGTGLVLAGVLYCALHEPGGIVTGHRLLVLTGGMWATYALVVRKSGIPALHATAIVAVGSAVLYLPVYAVALPKQIFAAPVQDILMQVGFQGILVSVVAVFSFNRSAELLGPVAGAALPALIPLATLGIGAVVLREPAGGGETTIAAGIGIGVALILAGHKHAVAQISRAAQ